MRIVAALAWYDEPVGFLTRCVESLAGFADTLIAIDGPWEGHPLSASAGHPLSPWKGHPDGNVYSSPFNYTEIHAAANQAGLDLKCSRPNGSFRGFNSQVEKRDLMMRAASTLGDWVLVIDGDEWIDNPHAEESRALLAATDLDVASIAFRNVTGGNQAPSRIRRIYRTPVTVERSHHGYKTLDGRWLHGDPTRATLEPTVDVPLSMLHQQADRGPERNAAATAYREHRRRNQTERWNQPDHT